MKNKHKKLTMEHPAELNSNVQLAINDDLTIDTRVMGYELNEVDEQYHYHLQGELSDGNTVAVVQFEDVIQGLVKLKDE